MIDLAVVPVGGFNWRLWPATRNQPREMLPLGRKPAVQYVVEELAHAGVRKIVFVTGPGAAAVEGHFDHNAETASLLRESGREDLLDAEGIHGNEMQYAYVRQRRPLGLGHAVLCARAFVNQQPFVVALGDSVIGPGPDSRIVPRLIEEYERTRADAAAAFEEVTPEQTVHYGIALPKRGATSIFELADIVEKPAAEEAPSLLAAAGRYVLSPGIFELLEKTAPGKNQEVQLTDALRTLLMQGGRFYGVRLPPEEKRYDLRDFDSYCRAFVEIAMHDAAHGGEFRSYLRGLFSLPAMSAGERAATPPAAPQAAG